MLKEEKMYDMIMWEGWERRDSQRIRADGIPLAERSERVQNS